MVPDWFQRRVPHKAQAVYPCLPGFSEHSGALDAGPLPNGGMYGPKRRAFQECRGRGKPARDHKARWGPMLLDGSKTD